MTEEELAVVECLRIAHSSCDSDVRSLARIMSVYLTKPMRLQDAFVYGLEGVNGGTRTEIRQRCFSKINEKWPGYMSQFTKTYISQAFTVALKTSGVETVSGL